MPRSAQGRRFVQIGLRGANAARERAFPYFSLSPARTSRAERAPDRQRMTARRPIG